MKERQFKMIIHDTKENRDYIKCKILTLDEITKIKQEMRDTLLNNCAYLEFIDIEGDFIIIPGSKLTKDCIITMRTE
jgi:hypothetical protein